MLRTLAGVRQREGDGRWEMEKGNTDREREGERRMRDHGLACRFASSLSFHSPPFSVWAPNCPTVTPVTWGEHVDDGRDDA